MLAKLSFLSLLSISLGKTESNLLEYDEISWEEVFHLAEQHHVLPMVVDTAYRIYGSNIPHDCLTRYKKRAKRMTYLQTLKTERFLSLYKDLSAQGLTPLVMKGLICRKLYPNSEFRFSADEDLLIPPNQALVYHNALLVLGLKTDVPEQSMLSEPEIPYRSEDGVVFLEVHRFPFPPDSGAYGEYNRYFTDDFDRAVTETYAGVEIRTLAPTDHLFYLICHALKHFLHGGCGIRQVCDIGLFAQAYAGQIDWEELTERISSIRAKDFTASILTIVKGSLGIDLQGIPDGLCSSGPNPQARLDDILASGVYGSSTMSRKHSATITLRAAEDAESVKTDKKRTRTLFPPASDMVKRYPYLETKPWLLPAAWIPRISRYLKSREAGNTPSEALRIGHERVSLMEEYGLLSEAPVKNVDTEEYLSALCKLVEEGHEVSIPVAGSSMTPFLGDGRDQVFVKAPWRQIQKGDIVLYRRRNGDFVLHRVHLLHGNGDDATYDVIGDAQDKVEQGVQRSQILAVATRARRKGKTIEPGCFYWWFFRCIWIRMIPLRRRLMRLYAVLNKSVSKY